MKKNKKYFLIGVLVLVLIVLILCLLMYLNSRKNGYSFSEKSFINSNLNNVIAIIKLIFFTKKAIFLQS